MANGKDYAPDFADAPRPQRAVPKNVERAAAGALKKNIGAGRAWSAFESGATKQSHMAAYAQIGAEAAQGIRQRFYKKEWDQVKKLKVDPLLAQLAQAKAEYEQRTITSVMPVARTVPPEEGRQRAAPVPMETKVAGAEGQKDGTKIELVPGENYAEGPGQYGATELQDMLAIRDPATGQPVSFHGDPGQAIHNRAVDDFWGQYGTIATQIMDVMGEYQGNPFADYAGGTMIEQVMKQAGQGVTGKTTPEDQRAAWEHRQQFDQGMEKGRLDISNAQQAQEQAIGMRAGEASAARDMASDERYAEYFKPGMRKKWADGTELTSKEQYEAIGIKNSIIKQEQAGMALAAKGGLTRLPQTILTQPTQWGSHLRGTEDEGYANIYDDLNQEVVVTSYNSMMEDPAAFIEADPNMPTKVFRLINADQFDDPRVIEYLQQTAASPELQADFHATATALRMTDLAQQDPRVQDQLDRMVAGTRQQWIDSTGAVPENVAMMLATSPEAFYVGAATGANAGLRKPPGWKGAVQRYKASQQAKQGLSLPGQPAAERRNVGPISERTYTEDQIQTMGENMEPRLATERQNYDLRDLMKANPDDLKAIPQPQLKAALQQVNRLLVSETMSHEEKQQLQQLQSGLASAHKGPFESFLKGQVTTIGGGLRDLFTTTDEEKQRAEQKRQSLWLVE